MTSSWHHQVLGKFLLINCLVLEKMVPVIKLTFASRISMVISENLQKLFRLMFLFSIYIKVFLSNRRHSLKNIWIRIYSFGEVKKVCYNFILVRPWQRKIPTKLSMQCLKLWIYGSWVYFLITNSIVVWSECPPPNKNPEPFLLTGCKCFHEESKEG